MKPIRARAEQATCETGATTMQNDLSGWTTSDLISKSKDFDDGDLSYHATWALISRWRKGVDLEALIGLLRSERSSDRAKGAYCLDEAGRPSQGDIEALDEVVIKLADDADPDCQRVFVKYVRFSRLYDEPIANALAGCLLDWNLMVRWEVINWAISAPNERLESFSQLVKSGAGARKPRFGRPEWNEFWRDATERRALRALDIIHSVRAGNADQIRESIPNEDSIVLDRLYFSNVLLHQSRTAARERR